MKTFARIVPALCIAAAALAGCATNGSDLVLAPVGPSVIPTGTLNSTGGQLLVFSAHDPSPHFNSLPYEDFYTDYEIVSPNGARRVVRNNPNPSVPGPVAASLPAGEYQIIARANGYGAVTVPVMIEPGQTTTVHLDSEEAWQPGRNLKGAAVVQLPDGEVVGPSAAPVKARANSD